MCDLEEFDAKTLEQTSLAIFLMATYGEGEPTDNAAAFFKWLKPDGVAAGGGAAVGCLSKLSFSVFGLGNRQYEHFNRMGKLINDYLAEPRFGAKRAYAYGEGDDDGTLEEDFDAWRKDMWQALLAQFHPNGNGNGQALASSQTSSGVSAVGGGSSPAASVSLVSASSGGGDELAKALVNRMSLQFEMAPQPRMTAAQAEAARLKTFPNLGKGGRGRGDSWDAAGASSPASSASSSNIAASSKHFFSAVTSTVRVNRELRTLDKDEAGSTRHFEIDMAGTG